MRDPEIQAIMSDPVFQAILQQAQNEPASLQQHMQNPGIRAKIEKLARAVSWPCFVGVEEGADWFETSRVSSRRGKGERGRGLGRGSGRRGWEEDGGGGGKGGLWDLEHLWTEVMFCSSSSLRVSVRVGRRSRSCFLLLLSPRLGRG